MQEPQDFARLLEVLNAVADAMHTHDRQSIVSFYKTPLGRWGIFYTDDWLAPPAFSEVMSALAEEYDFEFHPVSVSGDRMVMDLRLLPQLEALGSPITEALDPSQA